MMGLAVDTITAAANTAGITSVEEYSETISDRLKNALPRMEYSVLTDEFDSVRTGLMSVSKTANQESRVRRTHRRVLQIRCLIAAETESGAESYLKSFLQNLPRHVADENGFDVLVKPLRTERKGFTRKLVDVFPQKEIAVFISFTGGVYVDETVGMIKGTLTGISITLEEEEE